MTESSDGVRAWDESPHLVQVTANFYDSWDDHGLDPELVLIERISREDAALALEELRIIIGRSSTEADMAREFQALGVKSVLPPEGNNWHRWAAHLEQMLLHPPPRQPEDFNFLDLPRTSRFVDETTANTASTLVLRAHEARVREWAERNDGWWRLHLYADLTKSLGRTGWMLHHGQEEPEPVSGAVVLMQLRYEDRGPYIATAYPEVRLDTGVRERWPDLCNLIGGYFGQDGGYPWPAQSNAISVTLGPARDRMRAQLDELLTEPDDERLAEHLDNLGSYLRLVDPRGWLERMRYRMDAFDWSPMEQE